MSDYKPSQIVVSLCKKLGAIPIAEAIRLDGTVVIVVADGRKLTFLKDDITRTLTESSPTMPATESVDSLEELAPAISRSRKHVKKENSIE